MSHRSPTTTSRGMSPPERDGTKRARMPSRALPPASSRASTAPTRTSSVSRWRPFANCSQRFQILDEIVDVRGAQVQAERVVVMLDHGLERGEAAVVIEAAFRVRPDALERRRAITVIRRPIGLEVVDADLLAGVHRPARLAVERRHVAGRAACLPLEERLAACCGRRVEAAA